MKTLIKKIFWPGPDFGTRDRYKLKKLLLKGPGVRTLDVGFGNGCMTIYAGQKGEYSCGVSILEHEVIKANNLKLAFGLDDQRCMFKKVHLNEMDESDSHKFDQIIMFEVLEHIVDDKTAVEKAYRLLKERGQLHVCVPNRDFHFHFEPLNRFENGGHVRHGYDFQSLQYLLENAGFEILDRRGVSGNGSVLGFKVVAFLRKFPGPLGQILSLIGFLIMWPVVQLINVFNCRPWSIYMLACKR
ncbi:MAG: hypothetical protein OHK0056_13650 [Bacteriovoracaceae bacterium]